MIITQDLEHFHGWGLTMAMRRGGTFALGQRQCWPHSSGRLVCDKKKYKLPVKFLHWPHLALSGKSYKVWMQRAFQDASHPARTQTVPLHTNELILDNSLHPPLTVGCLFFCVCAYHPCWRESVLPSGATVRLLGLNTCGTWASHLLAFQSVKIHL